MTLNPNVATEIDELLKPGHVIGGERSTGSSAGHYLHRNPANGRPQCEVPLAGAEEVGQAVGNAQRAFEEWRGWPAGQRRDVLLRLAVLLREKAALLGKVATLEGGVPTSMSALLSGSGPAEWFSYYAGWVDKIEGNTLSPLGYGGLDYTLPEPFGVVAAIIPWNGPLTTIGMKVAPALAAGNCVVIKPSEFAPFTALHFADLALEAGIPPGVVNVVVGSGDAGDALVRDPRIGKVSFTGGPQTAEKIITAAAGTLTPTVMELGGKSANIVFPDAALAAVIPQAVITASLLSGQVCTCPSRLLVHESLYGDAVAMAEATATSIAVGDPFDPATVMGPVINAEHLSRILAIIDRARAEQSGRLVAGGARLGGSLAEGYFLEPTVFADVDPSGHLAQNEVFGPVLAIASFRDDSDAIALANGTKYGLAAFVWTSDLHRAHRVAANLTAGTVSINSMMGYLAPNTPYGGMGASGFGREGGAEGLKEFLRTKNVYVPAV